MKNSFTVQLGVRLLLESLHITGCFNSFLSPFLAYFFGAALDFSIFNISLTINSLQVGMKYEKFREHAIVAYKKAKAKVYTEEEKRAIRKEFLDATRDFVRIDSVQ